MPTTRTAKKIHVLTPPELRALSRVITRGCDRAPFLVRTVRRVALVGLTACLVTVLTSHRGAAAEPPGVLRHLAGCCEVSSRVADDGVHGQDIRGALLEELPLDRARRGLRLPARRARQGPAPPALAGGVATPPG